MLERNLADIKESYQKLQIKVSDCNYNNIDKIGWTCGPVVSSQIKISCLTFLIVQFTVHY